MYACKNQCFHKRTEFILDTCELKWGKRTTIKNESNKNRNETKTRREMRTLVQNRAQSKKALTSHSCVFIKIRVSAYTVCVSVYREKQQKKNIICCRLCVIQLQSQLK